MINQLKVGRAVQAGVAIALAGAIYTVMLLALIWLGKVIVERIAA